MREVIIRNLSQRPSLNHKAADGSLGPRVEFVHHRGSDRSDSRMVPTFGAISRKLGPGRNRPTFGKDRGQKNENGKRSRRSARVSTQSRLVGVGPKE